MVIDSFVKEPELFVDELKLVIEELLLDLGFEQLLNVSVAAESSVHEPETVVDALATLAFDEDVVIKLVVEVVLAPL